MAGLGRRTFAAGEVLTASNVMGYLQDQAVMTFAGTAARGSAIGTATEGMVSYLSDTNLIQVYDGSAWKQVYPAVPTTGGVKQVVSTAKLDTTTVTGTSAADITGLTVAITPASASNKVLVIAQITASFATQEAFLRLSGGNATTYIGATAGSRTRGVTQPAENAGGGRATTQTLIYLDSPATTSAVTYAVQGWVVSGGSLYINRSVTDTDNANFLRGASSITAIEVVA